ncbi:AAA family ATPase [Actinocatenispora rupis]|uniref:ATPase n=1 Tax=Actinocatenispora rupis TaxID=519421 RepID=A0A8J3NFF3_9ACTN|nr:AAA family ATPase [Actinocatenispora rupis]GID13724.1 ATPase [Actinocatenispora rupis]
MSSSLTLTASLRSAALDGRRGIVRLHPEVLEALGLRPGAPVLLTGRRTSAGVALAAEAGASRALLYADDLTLGNLGIRDGAEVSVASAPVTAARTVTVAGEAQTVAVVSPEMLRLALLGKVVTAGDNVSLLPQDVAPPTATRGRLVAAGGAPPAEVTKRSLSNSLGMGWVSLLLTVTDATPADPGAGRDAVVPVVVTMDTVVRWDGGPATHSSATPAPVHQAAVDAEEETAVGVADLAGLRAQAQELTELLDLGFHHGEILARLGTDASLGVLVTGPAGSGKSTLVHAVAHEVSARVVTVWAPEVAALANDPAAARLTDAVARAQRPAVLLVSDVEALAPKGSPGPLSTVLTRVVRTALDAGIAVVCTSSRPEDVDPALRGPDLLAHEIAVPLPDAAGRRELLAVLTRDVRLAEDVRLDDVVDRTPGFVAADLLALVREAGVRAAVRHRNADTDADPAIAAADFATALDVVRPTTMTESGVDIARVSLDDVGDMADVKQVLTESVLWPLTYPDTFDRLGIDPPRGVLLYGPPGCGKTFLVKAIAGEGRANVFSVKGAELLSKWVGDSERAVRELFRRARDAAPSLVFLDEIDALAPVRGQATDGGTTDRVVASLLTELDGVESLRNVVVVGATNRPDLVDPALLRPGRLERLVYVPPPDSAARKAILTSAARRVPLAADVDLASFADDLDGFSSADCAALVREAALSAMRESLTATEVTATNVRTALARVRPSLDPDQVAWLAAYADKHQPT